MKAKISEIFSSLQGEGVYQGQKQVFVRFFGCNLKCSFCDTIVTEYVEKTVEEVVEDVLTYKDFHSVSLTGGEPLLQVGFIRELSKQLRKYDLKMYLETNGVLSKELKEIIDYIDIVSMDFKLPTSTGLRTFWNEHRDFLKVAKNKEIFIKVVIGKSTQLCDIYTTIGIIKEVKPDTKLILQLQNPFEEDVKDKAISFERLCRDRGVDVSIKRQQHKVMGVK